MDEQYNNWSRKSVQGQKRKMHNLKRYFYIVVTKKRSQYEIVTNSETMNVVIGKDVETTQANTEKFANLVNKKAKANRRKKFDNLEPKIVVRVTSTFLDKTYMLPAHKSCF